eukprot:9158193-Alexandrium_andersonii.AAC.1
MCENLRSRCLDKNAEDESTRTLDSFGLVSSSRARILGLLSLLRHPVALCDGPVAVSPDGDQSTVYSAASSASIVNAAR